MKSFRFRSVAEQVAAHLRGEMEEGRLSGMMPGVLRLDAEMGVNRKTLETAFRILERDGLLQSQGPGKRRLIVLGSDDRTERRLRIGLFFFERQDASSAYTLSLIHLLEGAGHTVIRATAALSEPGMDLRKIARIVEETRADAWVVFSASQEMLNWFIDAKISVMAVFGRRRGLALPSVGPDKITAYRETTRALLGLGHRRIVWLARRMRRLPKPGEPEQAFLDELTAHDVPPGPYHLPDWKETVEGLHNCLDSMFRFTPPTAIVADEPQFYVAIENYLCARKLSVPGDVSLVCTDSDPVFNWCQPSVAQIRWEHQPLARRVVKWAENISRGKDDKTHTFIPAEFVPGGTIGPAKRASNPDF